MTWFRVTYTDGTNEIILAQDHADAVETAILNNDRRDIDFIEVLLDDGWVTC